jgi:hypothetical protein
VLDDKSISAGILWTRVDTDLGGLYVSYLATRDRIDRVRTLEWHDPNLDRRSNKYRMKEVGAAYMQYLIFLKTSSILGLAKAIEDCIWLSREETGVTFDFWRDADKCPQAPHAKELRSLANAIKHNFGLVRASDSKSSAYLVSERGYKDGMPLDLLMFADEGAFNIPNSITQMYLFLVGMVRHVTGVNHSFAALSGDELFGAVREALVPEILGL